MLHINFKKSHCRQVEFKKQICHCVNFRDPYTHVCTWMYYLLFHLQIATCIENMKLQAVKVDLLPGKAVKDSIYCPEL